MSIYRIIWWVAAAILTASGGIVAAATVPTDILVSAVIAAVLIGGGSPWLRHDHASHYSTAPNSPDDCATRRRYVGGSRDHCHRIDRALRRCCLTVDTADDPHLGSDVSLHRRQSRVHTGTTMLAEKSPDTHQHRRCAASSAAGLQPTLGRSPVPMLAHELAPLCRTAPRHRRRRRTRCTSRVPASVTSTKSNVAILEDSPDGSAAVLVPVVTPRSSSPHEIIPSPRHRNPDGKPCTIPKPPTDSRADIDHG